MAKKIARRVTTKKATKKAAKKVRTPRTSDLATALAKTKSMSPSTSSLPMTSEAQSSEAMMMSATQLVAMLVGLFVVNFIFIGLANWFFPTQVVLGTYQLGRWMALISSTGVLTLILVGLVPLIELLAKQARIKLSDSHWIALYWLMNAAGLWLVARFADILGLGLASWVVAVALAAVLDAVQGVVVTKFVSKVK